MKLLAGNSNLPLAKSISDYLEIELTEASVRRFADEEIFVEINENVRGEDVFVVQSTSYPANDNLMELLICIDALRRASAKRITAVVPYFGYARQDRKPGPRTPISAKLVANLITVAGASRVLSIDLHAGQIQGFFDIPTDNLFASPVIAADIKARFANRELLVVSPDVGGVVRARSLAKRIGNVPLAIVDKRRERAGESEVMNIIGEVEGRTCILIDDIVDSAGTLCNAAAAFKQEGADRSVRLFDPRRALGRGGGARRQVRIERAGRHRHDLERRARPQGRQNPPPDHRAFARRGDPPDRRRKFGVEPVRLGGRTNDEHDAGLWKAPITDDPDEAKLLLEPWYEREDDSAFEPSEDLRIMLDRLLAQWPFDPETGTAPWADGPENTGRLLDLSISWGGDDRILADITALARIHGLVLYDPQGPDIFLPTDPIEELTDSPASSWSTG